MGGASCNKVEVTPRIELNTSDASTVEHNFDRASDLGFLARDYLFWIFDWYDERFTVSDRDTKSQQKPTIGRCGQTFDVKSTWLSGASVAATISLYFASCGAVIRSDRKFV